MGVTVFVFIALIITLIALPIIATGVIFLIIYFLRRSPEKIHKKAGLVLPVIAVCIGEILLTPVCGLGAILMSNVEYGEIIVYTVMGLGAAAVLAGLTALIAYAVKAKRNEKTSNAKLGTATAVFLAGFGISVPFLLFLLCLVLTSH